MQALRLLGRDTWALGDCAGARALLEEALALCRAMGDKAELAQTLHILADARRDQGEYAGTDELYQESLALYQELGDQHGSAWVYHAWGEMALLQGDYRRALTLGQASLGLFRELGYIIGMVHVLLNQAVVAQHQGNYDQAANLSRESLLLARTLERSWLIKLCLVGCAAVAAAQSQQEPSGSQGAERAARLLGAVEALNEETRYRMVQAHRLGYERAVATARAQLDEGTFAVAWAVGRAMSLEEATASALNDVPTIP
jgi:tetratricopeptide (TPR) repeat protein